MDGDELIARAFEELRRRAGIGAPGATVRQIYDAYERVKCRGKSWPIVRGKLRPTVELFGDREATTLTIGETEDYRAARRLVAYPRGKGKTYTDQSINHELMWLKAILNWAVRGGRLTHNPLALMRAAKAKKHRKTSPTEDEIGRLLVHASTLMRAFILLAADSGMRRDEIRLCRWSWIDEGTRMLTLPAAATKSQRERRVPVTERTFAALADIPRHISSPHVFVNARTHSMDRPFDSKSVDAWFREIVDAAGVVAATGDGGVRLHDLRHSYARRAARAGVRVEVIAMILGHANIQQTMAYLQTGDDDVIDALDVFEAGLRKPARASKSIDVGRHATRSERGE